MSHETPQPESGTVFSGAELAASLNEAAVSATRTLPERITQRDIQAHVPKLGGTEIILQRHGEYIRDEDDPFVGSLTGRAERDQNQLGYDVVAQLIGGIPEAERENFDILVVASDTQYQGGGRRSMETAEAVWDGMAGALADADLDSGRIINVVQPVQGIDGQSITGVPQVEPRLREPQMFSHEAFSQFLTERYGAQTRDFWIAFEEDRHAEDRATMNAEGPDDIADRTQEAVSALAEFAKGYHDANPGRRLLIWAATHYDTISPFVKLKLAGGTKQDGLPVDFGGGIAIDLAPDGRATSTIADTTYDVPLHPRG